MFPPFDVTCFSNISNIDYPVKVKSLISVIAIPLKIWRRKQSDKSVNVTEYNDIDSQLYLHNHFEKAIRHTRSW